MEENLRCGRGHRDARILWLKKLGPRGAVLCPGPYCEHWSVKLEPNVTYWNSPSVIQQTFFSPHYVLGTQPPAFALDSIVCWFRINFQLMSVRCDFSFSCLELWVDFVWSVQMPWKINEALAVGAAAMWLAICTYPPFLPQLNYYYFVTWKLDFGSSSELVKNQALSFLSLIYINKKNPWQWSYCPSVGGWAKGTEFRQEESQDVQAQIRGQSWSLKGAAAWERDLMCSQMLHQRQV